MDGERFGVDARDRLEHPRETGVVVAQRPRRELRDDRLAHAIVEHLDDLSTVAKTGAHEAPATERRDRVLERLVDPRGVADDRDG